MVATNEYEHPCHARIGNRMLITKKANIDESRAAPRWWRTISAGASIVITLHMDLALQSSPWNKYRMCSGRWTEQNILVEAFSVSYSVFVAPSQSTAKALPYETLLSLTSSTRLLRSYRKNLNLPLPSPRPSAFSTAAMKTPIGCRPQTVLPVSFSWSTNS